MSRVGSMNIVVQPANDKDFYILEADGRYIKTVSKDDLTIEVALIVEKYKRGDKFIE